MKLTLNLGKRSHDIIIHRGTLSRAGQLANLTGRVMVVTDGGVPAKYVKALLAQCGQGHSVALPEGERGVGAWTRVMHEMHQKGFGPGDTVAALGGTTVGDVASFAAANYMGGVALCRLPTTTASQLDTATGGLCGISLAPGEAGVRYQPVLVGVDPDLVSTLPPRHRAAGMAAALKMGLLGSRELFELLEAGDADENYERILYLCLRYKKGLVEQDEAGRGEARLLDFGGAVGRAILAADRGKLLYGEAAALGMLPVMENRTLVRRTRVVMKKLGLPLKAPCPAAEVAEKLMDEAPRWPAGFVVPRVKRPGHGYLEVMDPVELVLLVTGK